MPKLTDTQLVILPSAAQRHDSAILPLPKSLKVQGRRDHRPQEPAQEGLGRRAAGGGR